MKMTELECEHQRTANEFVGQHSEVFDGHLGCIPGTIHLDINSDATPVQLAVRRIPIALKEQLIAELKRPQVS